MKLVLISFSESHTILIFDYNCNYGGVATILFTLVVFHFRLMMHGNESGAIGDDQSQAMTLAFSHSDSPTITAASAASQKSMQAVHRLLPPVSDILCVTSDLDVH